MEVLGIIPARAGSRGVPGKNVRDLLGRAVISYSIEAARAATRLGRVVVSSDDPAVGRVCRECGVDFLERPSDLAGDTARIDDVMRQVCGVLEEREGYRPGAVALLYANVPVRAEGIIDRVIEKLVESGCDSVQTIAPVGKYHPFWLYRMEGDKIEKYVDNKIYRRQELPAVYAIDSAVGLVRYEVLMAAAGSSDPHAFWGADRRALVQEAHETVDIDSPRDFYVAEAILRRKHEA